MEEYRIKNETLEENKISSLIESELEKLGYLIVQVKINNHEKALQIMMERIIGELGINDCSKASRAIMPMIEANALLPENYRIEISSPGIDRILVRQRDFIQNIGNEIKVELNKRIENKKKYDEIQMLLEFSVSRVQRCADLVDLDKLNVKFFKS